MLLASLLAITIALFAVLHFWAVPAACRRVIGPGRALATPMGGVNSIGTVKRWVVLPIAELVQRLHPLVSHRAYRCIPRGAKCLIRLIF